MRHPLACLAALASLAACGGGGDGAVPLPPPVTLLNDGYAGGSAGFQAGFVAGEEAAVTLGPVDRPFQVTRVRFLFGGAAGSRDVEVRIYRESGAAEPGVLLHTWAGTLTASDTTFQEIDLSAGAVTLPAGSVRVSVRFTLDGAPAVARDDDGITAGRNWIMAIPGGWLAASTLGVTGDWIVRAVVQPL